MQVNKLAHLLALYAGLCPLSAKQLPLVPYPQEVKVQEGKNYQLAADFSIACPAEFEKAASIFLNDLKDLYGRSGTIKQGQANITLVKNESLKEEAYQLRVTPKGVSIQAANYKSMMMGLTSLLQMTQQDTKSKTISLPCCIIKDAPAFNYRNYMVDLARQWVEVETLKNMIDLCRWYKVRYLQLHLTDFQSCTFESKICPDLTKDSKHYTQEQLKDLVQYATDRGIILIPEFDLPGHSSAISRAMPEVFGNPNWGVIDMANPKTMAAAKAVAKEMMSIFHTSPYFHIGADEVELHNYEKLEHVQAYIKEKNYDNAYDVYMECVASMHDFVKSCGKKTLVWESFRGTGSAKVKIPTDLTVIAWDSTFQSPMSLVENGYEVVNGSWIPFYMTPRRRWSPESIYNWNPRKWDIFWVARNPISWDYPVQLDKSKTIKGMQMCAWEMINYEQLISAQPRIAPFSEIAWRADNKGSYAAFTQRAQKADAKISTLLFPATEERSGFKDADPLGLDDNLINTFCYQAKVFFKPLDPTNSIYYSSNSTFPSIEKGTKMTEPITVTTTGVINFAIYNKEGELKAYKSNRYEIEQIDASYEGEILPIAHPQINITQDLEFIDTLKITLTNGIPNTKLYYTLDGSKPNINSIEYTGPIILKENARLYVYSLDADGKAPAKSMSFTCNYKRVAKKETK